MKTQTWVFIVLVAIVGFVLYTNNQKEAGKDAGADDANLEVTDDVMMEKDDSDTMEDKKDDVMMEKDDNDTMEDKKDDVMMEKDDNDTMEDKKDDVMVNIDGQGYVSYQNKAASYTVERPNNWYWQHYHQALLTETYPNVQDILALDRKTLPAITDIYDAKIVVEISNRNLESELSGLVAISDEAGVTRYEGTRDGKEVIEVHMAHGNGVARFVYKADTKDEGEVAVFDHMVATFSK